MSFTRSAPATRLAPRFGGDERAGRFSRVAAAFAIGLFVAALAPEKAAAEQAPAAGPAGAPVAVAQAAAGCFSEAIHAGGFLAPRADAVVILTLENYQVAEVLAAEGDSVADGQPLARIAKIEAPNPYPPGMGPPPAPGPVLPASIVLRAPAAGTIVKSRARIGAGASAQGDPLFALAIDGLIEALAQVPSVHISEVKADQTVSITVEDGREISGRVRRIGSRIDPVTQMGEVRVAIERDPALRAGRLIRAKIDARHSCGLSIPRSALFYSNEGASVQIVRGKIIETARVRVGLSSGADAEIEAGLHAGDLVVLNAGGSLRDGDVVTPILPDEQGQDRDKARGQQDHPAERP
ncbi:efflux RND transporter periplasmic adaptor subunit [Methylocella silvestris]|uniref:Efflux transporter periplasmic adaptor subunit n=1 Tax=Methylocella silvestris TaxID=199596 RepID=A0A2J7TIY7_METSI|nr:efflux RND transporter periplasmic adaptor subunit [Methylocella silvestris]PNG26731.1 efflux transporter periplasmic adaptor subunit [Methylocella silvestris]